MKNGLSKKEVKKIEREMKDKYATNDILCFVCYQEGKPQFFKQITNGHLKHSHSPEFEIKNPVRKYKALYPGARVRRKGLIYDSSLSKEKRSYSQITSEKIFAEIEEMGISRWAEKEGLEMYIRLMKLADDMQEQGKPKDARKTIEKAKEILIQFLPSRSQRNATGEIKGISKEDEETLNKQDELLDLMKKDLKGKSKSSPVQKGWYKSDAKVSLYGTSEEIPKSV
jgi:hypothetical protein